jgi:hypothetical protein
MDGDFHLIINFRHTSALTGDSIYRYQTIVANPHAAKNASPFPALCFPKNPVSCGQKYGMDHFTPIGEDFFSVHQYGYGFISSDRV